MRAKSVTIFLVLLVVAGFLIFLNVKSALKPVQSVGAQAPRPLVYIFSGIGNSVKSFFSYFGDVHTLNSTNGQLSGQIRQLQQENIVLQQEQLENQQLKNELGYRQSSKFQLISASAIASDPTGFSQTVIINAGSSEGVTVGSAVLAQGVLVGTVSSVDTFTSKVLLVTDPQSAIPAQISGTTDSGILRGSYGSGIVLAMTAEDVQIQKGDEVITTGLSPNVPRGILVGTIGDVQSQKNDLLQSASVISGVDLKNLSFLSVIKN